MEGNCSRPPLAVFMAFGTKGDVLPVAAIAAALACDQRHYRVMLITHSAHKYLTVHLTVKGVSYIPISTPPVLSIHQDYEHSSLGRLSFSLQKKVIMKQHREECLSAMERAFGKDPAIEGDFIVINFFALEGWHLAELFRVPCVVAAPYVVPYSVPSSFERHFSEELPLLYRYLQEAPLGKVCWKDVIHWMWPLFTDDWGSWRSDSLNLSPCPFTDPVTGMPMWHDWVQSPLLLYGFSKEVVECPGYWPSNVHVCGFWFVPTEWQFSCNKCRDISAILSLGCLNMKDELCASHADLQQFLGRSSSTFLPVFIGLSSIGRTIPYSWLFPRCSVSIHHGGSGSTAAALYAGIPQVICPFMLDQFYWAERMFWLGVAPEPLHKSHLLPDNDDDVSINLAATALSKAIKLALSEEIKIRALEIAERISSENGVSETLKVLKEEICLVESNI